MTHKNITKYLKFPLQFNEAKLMSDLNSITSNHWRPQIYTMNYQGEWTSIALISEGGTDDNFSYGSASEEMKETALLKNCLYFKSILDGFQFPLISARLLKLCAHSEIKPHQDYKLGYEDHNFRIHIPIVTNNQIEFIVDGEKLVLLPGECWYINVNFTHSVANRSSEDRIHLVIDGERNEWSDKMFFKLAPKESFNIGDKKFSDETKKSIIEELKNINVAKAEDLIINI